MNAHKFEIVRNDFKLQQQQQHRPQKRPTNVTNEGIQNRIVEHLNVFNIQRGNPTEIELKKNKFHFIFNIARSRSQFPDK